MVPAAIELLICGHFQIVSNILQKRLCRAWENLGADARRSRKMFGVECLRYAYLVRLWRFAKLWVYSTM
jgi:hypothetical protein